MKLSSRSLEQRGFTPKKKKEEPVKPVEAPQPVVERVVEKEVSQPIIVPFDSPSLDRIESVLVELKKQIQENASLKSKGKPEGMDMKINRDKYGMIESASVTFKY